MRAICSMLVLSISLAASALALANPRAYLTDYNSGNVAVIDTATDTLVANSINVGPQAWSVAIGANDRVYFFSSNGISVVDAQSLSPVGTLALPACVNDSVIALDSTAEFIYVGCNPSGEVLKIDVQSELVVDTLVIAGAWFIDIILDADDDRVLVADNATGNVHVIDSDPLALDVSVVANVISSNGIDLDAAQNRLYVPTWSPNELSVIDPASGTIDVSIAVPGWHVSVDAGSAQHAYMLSPGGDVAVIDLATDSVLSTFTTGTGNYFSSAVHPSDGRLYLLNQSAAQVEVYDPVAETLLTTVTLPGFVEPRMVGRWLGAGPTGAGPAEAIAVSMFAALSWWSALMALVLVIVALLRIHPSTG